MALKKETMNLNCSITQTAFVPSIIFNFNSIPLPPSTVAIMEHGTEVLQPSADLCETTEGENRYVSRLW